MKAGVLAMAAAQVPSVTAGVALATRSPIVTDSGWLVGLLIVGATGGAFIAVAVWPPDETSERNVLRRLAVKFGASLLGGITLGPAAVRVLAAHGMPIDGDYVLGVGAAVAALIVVSLHYATPHVEAWLARAARRFRP